MEKQAEALNPSLERMDFGGREERVSHTDLKTNQRWHQTHGRGPTGAK